MDRSEFIHSFSRRLKKLVAEKGFQSNRSKCGIDITKLAQISDCSYQMARKYALGEALPELAVVAKIATWLDTSASWLLFGEKQTALSSKKQGAVIEIEPTLLKYILKKCSILFSYSNNIDEIVNFIVETVYDAAHLNSDHQTIYKIIDMMVASATLFHANTNQTSSAR